MPEKRDDWVCWQHAPLDFNDDDITFVVKAAKRMEQLLIHHYGVDMPDSHHANFKQTINRAKQRSDLKEYPELERQYFESIHQFRQIRNSMVHKADYDDLSKENRKLLNTACMEIFGILELKCNCVELYEQEKIYGYKSHEKIVLPDWEMYHYNRDTRPFLDIVQPIIVSPHGTWVEGYLHAKNGRTFFIEELVPSYHPEFVKAGAPTGQLICWMILKDLLKSETDGNARNDAVPKGTNSKPKSMPTNRGTVDKQAVATNTDSAAKRSVATNTTDNAPSSVEELALNIICKRKDWVCWVNSPLDFNDDDITFVVNATKRMEQLLIHHYGIKVPNTPNQLNFAQLINQAKHESGLLNNNSILLRHLVDFRESHLHVKYLEFFKVLHKFRYFRDKMVLTGYYNNFTREMRKSLNTTCMGIFGVLELECNCVELFEGEKFLCYHYKLCNTITLPDNGMYNDDDYINNMSTRLFINTVAPSTGLTPEAMGTPNSIDLSFCMEFRKSYLFRHYFTIILRGLKDNVASLGDAWNEHVSGQSYARTVSTNTIRTSYNVATNTIGQPDYIIIMEGAKKVVESIGHDIVKLFKIAMSISVDFFVLLKSLFCLMVLINIACLFLYGFAWALSRYPDSFSWLFL